MSPTRFHCATLLFTLAGTRTRDIRLEGEYANHYTTSVSKNLKKFPTGFEPVLIDSKSIVLTTRPWEQISEVGLEPTTRPQKDAHSSN